MSFAITPIGIGYPYNPTSPNYCSNCGAKNSNYNYCPSCGKSHRSIGGVNPLQATTGTTLRNIRGDISNQTNCLHPDD